ncbi:hypothetical protein BGZ75_001816 [Mortierella antarctica]|nr:hypothetical protein BGZ75_001816 [Mortierella antarctica]
MFTTSSSSSSSSSQPRATALSFLDPLDLDLPPPNSSNPITTIHEADEEDDPDYIHIHQNRRPISTAASSAAAYPYSEKQGFSAPPIQRDHTSLDHYEHPRHASIPFEPHHSYTVTPPSRSLASSPSLPSPHYSPQQLPPQPQPPTRYQYPRTRSSQFNTGGSAGGGLPLYASRTQRMRNGHSSSLDQSGKPIFRGPQTRLSSGGLSSSSSSGSDDDDEYFVGGRGGAGAGGGMGKRFSTFRGRRGRPWYQSRELQIVGAICFLALVVRLWHIGYPTSVVFDEVHFGGFASKYIRGRFFMDVHPPLAKMLIALTGWLFGLNPNFDFREIGMDYLEPKVPYVAMRMLGALMGVAVVPMAFYTIKNSGHSLHASILAAVLVLFENSIVTQSRLILLDSPLIFFTAFTVLAWTNFHNQRKYPFSDDWYIWLFLTGLGLGLAGSVKWVGLFIIATVGTSTINQLWILWGDLRVTTRVWMNHFAARAVCLIAVPVVVYMFMFEIHFLLLGSSGDGDGFMSAPFQMTLGHSLQDSPLDVAYGATLSIRHLGTQGGYLHSHPSNYETGSKQQQITLYPHKDSNNEWIIQRKDGTVPDRLEYVKNGDIIRLLHVPTSKCLHSHEQKAPITEDDNHFEVSGYGGDGFAGDANDEWRVEIVEFEGKNKKAGDQLHTLRSKFKLVHVNMACDLFSHKVKLPKWGFEQQEVTCMRSAVLAKSTWVIESNAYSAYPHNAPKVNYKKPGFFGKFIELNKVMWTTNAGLTDSHPYESRPSSWPWMRRGISFWGKDQKHMYLIGNWFTWYLSSFSIVLYAVIRILLVVRDKRGYRDNFRGLRDYYELSGGFFFMGWCYHYLPFFLMDRQLFLHHYLPALYFAILMLCVTFDLACRFIPNRYRLAALLIVSTLAILVFRARAPLTYGSQWTRSQCEGSKMLKTWDYDCYQYPESYAQYKPDPTPLTPQIGRIVVPTAAEENSSSGGGGGGADKPHDFLEHLMPHHEEGKEDSSSSSSSSSLEEHAVDGKGQAAAPNGGDVGNKYLQEQPPQQEQQKRRPNEFDEENIGEGGDDDEEEEEEEGENEDEDEEERLDGAAKKV